MLTPITHRFDLQIYHFIIFFLITSSCLGQSFSSIYRANQENDAAAAGVNEYNPYFDDYKIISSIRILNDVPGLSDAFWTPFGLSKELVNEDNPDKAFRFPIYTNVADWRLRVDSILTGLTDVSSLLMGETGVGIGASPYWILNERAITGKDYPDKFYFVAKSEIGLKYNTLEDVEQSESKGIFQLRTGLGAAMGFSIKDDSDFITIDLLAVYSSILSDQNLKLESGEELPKFSLEANVLVPLFKFEESPVLLGVEVFAPLEQEVRVGLGLFVPIGLKPQNATESN